MNHLSDTFIFCQNIRRLREKHRLSKTAMARKLNIGIKSLNALESGIIPPRLGSNIILDIYENFGITPNRMFSEII